MRRREMKHVCSSSHGKSSVMIIIYISLSLSVFFSSIVCKELNIRTCDLWKIFLFLSRRVRKWLTGSCKSRRRSENNSGKIKKAMNYSCRRFPLQNDCHLSFIKSKKEKSAIRCGNTKLLRVFIGRIPHNFDNHKDFKNWIHDHSIGHE